MMLMTKITCRPNCGACCIAPSISSPLPGLPNGKPAHQACLHLDTDFSCKIFNDPSRPQICNDFQPTEEICGNSRAQALLFLGHLETDTQPNSP